MAAAAPTGELVDTALWKCSTARAWLPATCLLVHTQCGIRSMSFSCRTGSARRRRWWKALSEGGKLMGVEGKFGRCCWQPASRPGGLGPDGLFGHTCIFLKTWPTLAIEAARLATDQLFGL
eukprot:359014-Chlamydomonas_euryale.AAC.13